MGKKLYGITTAMLTAFDQNGKVSVDKQKELTEFLIQAGVDCLYPLGTTGEMFRMDVEERETIAEAVVNQAAGRVTVYIHVGAVSTQEAVILAKHAESIGADGIAAVNPYYYYVSEEDIAGYYRDICRAVSPDFPVYIYNLPQCTTMDLGVDLVRHICDQNSNIVGIKYSYGDLVRTQDYIHSGISVMQGADVLFLESLALGVDGTVSGTSSVYPEPFVAMKKQWEIGNIDICRQLVQIIREYHRTIRAADSLECCKESLRYRGVDIGHARRPSQILTDKEIDILHDKLKTLDEKYLKKCIEWGKGQN